MRALISELVVSSDFRIFPRDRPFIRSLFKLFDRSQSTYNDPLQIGTKSSGQDHQIFCILEF